MHKRERLEHVLAGEKADRVPIALWRHWAGDDQRGADLAKAVFAFQKQWNFDLVVVTPANTASVVDYGLVDQWTGLASGKREVIQHPIQRSLDWTELRRLDPSRGSLGQEGEAMQLLSESYADEVPLLLNVDSPLRQACLLAGKERVIRDLRLEPERLKTGLNIITDNLLRFLESLRKIPMAGIFYQMDLADYVMLSEAEYLEFGSAYDQKVLGLLPETWWLNGVHLAGQVPMINLVQGYSAQVFSWADRRTGIDLSQGKSRLGGVVCGGLDINTLHTEMPSSIRDQARDALYQSYGIRVILSAGEPLYSTTPRVNIRAARQAVEDWVNA